MLDDDRYLAHLCGLAANPSLPRQLLDRLVTAASGELHDHPGAFELLAHPDAGTQRSYLDTGPLLDQPSASEPWGISPGKPYRQPQPGHQQSHPGAGDLRSRTATIGLGALRAHPGVTGPRDLAEFLAMTDNGPLMPPRLPSEPVAPPQETVRKNGLHIQATKNPDCSPELLHHIAQTANPDSVVHTEVAEHPNTTAATLLLCLARPAARKHAARHPNLPPHIITDLLDDPDLLVAEAAAANPALPPKIMEALLA